MKQLGFILLLFVGISCQAQSDSGNKNNIGLPDNGAFSGSDFDSIQLQNGNLHIEIPLPSNPGRGVSLVQKYVYDNRGWKFNGTCNKISGLCTDTVTTMDGSHMLLAVVGPSSFLKKSKSVLQACGNGNPVYTTAGVNFHESDGTTHHMLPDPAIAGGNTCWGDSSQGYFADDGSGIVYKTNGDVAAKDGTSFRYDPSNGNSITDSNGNQITYSITGTAYTDTLGRTIPPGSYLDSNGTARSFASTTVSVNINTHLCPWSSADYCNEKTTTWTVIKTLTLPNGLSYTFNYYRENLPPDGSYYYGEPLSVQMPTGGQIAWSWAADTYDSGGRYVCSRSVTSSNSPSGTWNYCGTGGVVDPAGNLTKYTYAMFRPTFRDDSIGQSDSVPYVTRIDYYNGTNQANPPIKTVQIDYSTASTVLPIRQTTTWLSQNLVTKAETDWDSFSKWSGTFSRKNVVNRREFAYGTGAPGSLVRTTTTSYYHDSYSAYIAPNIVNRPFFVSVFDGAGSKYAETRNYYDLSAPTATSSAPNHDYSNYGSGFNTRGNLSLRQNWRNTDGAYLNTSYAFDDLGNVLSTADNLSHTTSFSYADNFTDGGNRNTNAFVTQITYPVTGSVSHIEKKQYYYYSSQLAATCGQNYSGACTFSANPSNLPDYASFTYDLMLRQVNTATGEGGLTTAAYSSSLPYTVTTTTAQNSDPSKNIVTDLVQDDLGRAKQTVLHATEGLVKTDTTYDAMGRVYSVSNPYVSTSDATYGVTYTHYDPLGRVCKVIPADGTDNSTTSCDPATSTNVVVTSFDSNCSTVTDQASKKRKTCSDALGRLIQVFEDPSGVNYETDYQYDVLNNLLRSDQKGSAPGDSTKWRTRIFTYNSLSQLLTANNPESGSITYAYDGEGKLLSKTDARNIVTNYSSYDALHRLLTKTTSDSTINDSWLYDVPDAGKPANVTVNRGIGRLVRASNNVNAAEYDSYDLMGRLSTQYTYLPSYYCNSGSGWCNVTSANYDFTGKATALTYPSGRTVNFTFDVAGRPLTAADSGGTVQYITNAAYYDSTLGIVSKHWAPNLYFKATLNRRLQPDTYYADNGSTVIENLQYSYNYGVANNGNVISIGNLKDAYRSVSYNYDSLNRISSAVSGQSDCSQLPYGIQKSWGNSYGYDAWGNLLSKTVTKCVAETLSITVDNNNRVVGRSFDADGNLTQDGSATYSYDGDGQLTSTAGWTYIYDASGNRVRKQQSGSVYTEFISFAGGSIAERDPSGNWTEYIYFGGQRVVRRDPTGTLHYFHGDNLGTARIVTSSTGTIEEDWDFYPFGGERVYVTTLPSQRYKFNGKERDDESGLYDYGARFYHPSYGRWMSADWSAIPVPVPYATFVNPQTLNLYAYVANNPTTFSDMDGHVMQSRNSADAARRIDGTDPFLTFGVDPTRSSETTTVTIYVSDTSDGTAQSTGRQPDGSYRAPTGSGSAIAKFEAAANGGKPMGLVGSGECVDLTSHLTGVTQNTTLWRRGPKVVNADGTINSAVQPGTAIATFDANGRYPRGKVPKNSATFLGPGIAAGRGSISVMDQWNAHGQSPAELPQSRDVRYYADSSKNVSNNSNAYYVIVVPR